MNQKEYKLLVKNGTNGSFLIYDVQFRNSTRHLLFEKRKGNWIYNGLIKRNDMYHTELGKAVFHYRTDHKDREVILEPGMVLPTELNSILLGNLMNKKPASRLEKKFLAQKIIAS